jgi:nucleoside 2-deoxyribosyltransferase
MRKKVYIAGPLFSHAEKEFNERIDKYLQAMGFKTFLPQRDGYLLADLMAQFSDKQDAIDTIFYKDVEEIKGCDVVLFVLDGRVPDEGACVEVGLAYAYDKECIGFKSDSRSLMSEMDNPLLVGVLKGRIAKSFSELETFLLNFTTSMDLSSKILDQSHSRVPNE